jgi:CRISPR-associated protein Cas8a1/Csx13
VQSLTTTRYKIELHLSDPGMTLLHRAGIAGLWMTLDRLARQPEKVPQLSWKLTPRSVVIDWQGSDREALNALLKAAFGIDTDGLISLAGLGSETMDLQNRLTVHQGIRGTFLQHPSTYKAAGLESKALRFEEDGPELVVNYQTLASYTHQEFAEALCDGKGWLNRDPISVAGWLNPGAVVRHVAFSSHTGFEETPSAALALLFAPVSCLYFILRSRLRDKRAQYALVVPEVKDLELYARRRRQFRELGYRNFYASSLGDAGLRFLTFGSTAEIARFSGVQRCQVLTLGTVAWSSQQKSRTDLHTVEANDRICENYRLASALFTDRIAGKADKTFVATSFARGPFKFEVQQHLTELRIPPVVSDNQALFAGGH